MCYRRIDSDNERSLYTEVSHAEVRAGFRLPTIQEWMQACRAGSSTRRYWGNSEKLSPSYANYRRVGSRNLQPIASGTLMPNRLGCSIRWVIFLSGCMSECPTAASSHPQLIDTINADGDSNGSSNSHQRVVPRDSRWFGLDGCSGSRGGCCVQFA